VEPPIPAAAPVAAVGDGVVQRGRPTTPLALRLRGRMALREAMAARFVLGPPRALVPYGAGE